MRGGLNLGTEAPGVPRELVEVGEINQDKARLGTTFSLP